VPALKKKKEEDENENENEKEDQESVSTALTLDKEGQKKKMERGKSMKLALPKEVAAAPLVAPPETKQNELIPGAPGVLDMDKHFDDSSLGRNLSRGRLSIKCIEGIDIRRKDDQDRFPRNDPFLKFRLGVAERLPWKTTETKRKQDANPKFDGEIVSFDIIDPLQFIFQEDIQLCIELWNNSITKNELIGSVTMSVVRFFKQPFVSYTEKIPIYYPGVSRSSMRVRNICCYCIIEYLIHFLFFLCLLVNLRTGLRRSSFWNCSDHCLRVSGTEKHRSTGTTRSFRTILVGKTLQEED
jgi:hypothetical protein